MLATWRRFFHAPTHALRLSRGIADVRPFREGDLVLLRRTDDRSASPILSRPLKPGRRIEGHRGAVKHDDIIGRGVRDVVTTLPKRARQSSVEDASARSKPGQLTYYRLHEVKLEEYVRLTKRLVTPLYPQDARLIVELLDLHPPALLEHESEEKLEILEAGTGHGALTLHLARAICGANGFPTRPSGSHVDASALLEWKKKRKAVVHSIEVSERYSQHAEGVVRGFKHGTYYPHVDFHVGDVAEWINTALQERSDKAFLSHAFLDLPGAEGKLSAVAKALRIDGTLIVFNPSITQIMDAAKMIKDNDIPLDLERIIELGVNGGSGGREWDVRPVKPRAVQMLETATLQKDVEEEDVGQDGSDEATETDDEGTTTEIEHAQMQKNGWSMVCRPKVGERIVGGGFLGVWKKQRRD